MSWFDDARAAGYLNPAKIPLITVEPTQLWRVYSRNFGANGFNGTGRGNARLSPLCDVQAIVPTLYAADTLAGAMMETIFRDVPSPSTGHLVTIVAAVESRRLSALLPSANLRLVDLTTMGLRRLGLQRREVIDSQAASYPITRQLAEWLYVNAPDAQGIYWVSRQFDEGTNLMLFEPRLGDIELQVQRKDESFTEGEHWEILAGLAERLGTGVVIG